jgi:hypothetical protein
LSIIFASGFLLFILAGSIFGAWIDFEDFDAYSTGTLPTSSWPGIWYNPDPNYPFTNTWNVVDSACYDSEKCIQDIGATDPNTATATDTIPNLYIGYLDLYFYIWSEDSVNPVSLFEIYVVGNNDYQWKLVVDRGYNNFGVVKWCETTEADSFYCSEIGTLNPFDIYRNFTFSWNTFNETWRLEIANFSGGEDYDSGWLTASTTLNWEYIDNFIFLTPTSQEYTLIDEITLSSTECEDYTNLYECENTGGCVWVSGYPSYCALEEEYSEECACDSYHARFCGYDECEADMCYWVGTEEVGYCVYGTTTATSTFDTWEDFDLDLIKNPKEFFNWLEATFNPIRKPPLSWAVEIYGMINSINVEEYTASTSMWATGSSFGSATIPPTNFTPELTFRFFDLGGLADQYGDQFAVFRNILGFSLWLIFIWRIFAMSKDFINAISGQRVEEEPKE